MARTARDRLARTLDGDMPAAFIAGMSLDRHAPRLEVEGFGRVPSGIGEIRGRRLIALAEPVRFGPDGDAADEAAAPGAWEIPTRLVRVEWDPAVLREVLATVKEELGLPNDSSLTAELRSLLICEKGQFIPPAEEPAGPGDVFGTLTVTLPTAHWGGDLVIARDGEEMEYRGRTAVAFRAGCTREVRPVKSGYLLMLTFGLLLQGEAARAPGDEGIIAEAASLLREHFRSPAMPRRDHWVRYWGSYISRRDGYHYEDPASERPGRLIYLLDGPYAPDSLRWSGLAEADARRVELLRSAVDRAGYEAVLAFADIYQAHDVVKPDPWMDREYRCRGEVFAGEGHEYEVGQPICSRTALTRWAERNGTRLQDASLLARDTETCAATPDNTLTPASWHIERLADGGEALERWYHRAALIVWPRDRGFANRAEASPGWALDELLARASSGDVPGARAAAAALAPLWGRGLGEPPEDGSWAPGDITRIKERAAAFGALAGRALRAAGAVADPAIAAMLLRPFQIEDLTSSDVAPFARVAESYGGEWTMALLREWCAGEGTRVYLGGRTRWLGDWLRDLCDGLHARGGTCAVAARLLLDLAWEWLRDDIEAALSPAWTVSGRDSRLEGLGEPVAAALTVAAAIGASAVGDQVSAYIRRQPGDAATALEMPVLRALSTDDGFGELAADCAARLRTRLAFTEGTSGRWPAELTGLTDRELRERARDEADLEWLTARWRRAA
jgi:hypothetical protein